MAAGPHHGHFFGEAAERFTTTKAVNGCHQGRNVDLGIDPMNLLPRVFVGRIHNRTPWIEAPVETRFGLGMTGAGAALLDDVDEGIAVTVDEDVVDDLDVTTCLTLAPALVARSRVVDRLAGFQGFEVSGQVGRRDHEHHFRMHILGYDRQQAAAFVEIGQVDPSYFHELLSMSPTLYYP